MSIGNLSWGLGGGAADEIVEGGIMLAGPQTGAYSKLSSYFFFPSSNISAPIKSNFNPSYGNSQCAYGRGHFHLMGQTRDSRYWNIRDPIRIAPQTGRSHVVTTTGQEAVHDNMMWNVGYSTGRAAGGYFMRIPYNNVPRLGDVQVGGGSGSFAGWTIHTDVLPSDTMPADASNIWRGPVYNPDTDSWLIWNTTNILRTQDHGATWSSYNSPAPANTITSIVHGNPAGVNGTSKFILTESSYNCNRVWHSTNDGQNWTSHGTGSNMAFISNTHWNRTDNKWVMAGGHWASPSINSRIQTSLDGVTWTMVYQGTQPQGSLFHIHGDNQGNYIAVGSPYTNATGYTDTNVFLYSTNNGVNWSQGTLPLTVRIFSGNPGLLAHGDPSDNL